MRSITYTSAARETFSTERLNALLDICLRENAKWQITGMLLYHAGNFIQTIEGPPGHVEQLYKNICADQAHHHVIKVLDEEVDERHFGDWTMGFIDGATVKAELAGFTNFLRSPPTAEDFRRSSSDAKKMLASFQIWAR